jgi:hypothetical protein
MERVIDNEKESKRERERERVCVCVWREREKHIRQLKILNVLQRFFWSCGSR